MDRNNCVFITGATGKCGRETIKSLTQNFPNIRILAAVRDTSKARECFSQMNCKGLEFCQLEQTAVTPKSVEEMTRLMKGCGAVLIIPPAEETALSRVEVSRCYVEAAKKAGVEYCCLISSGCVDRKNVLFHRQFVEIETCVKQSGMRYCFLRCEMFMENNLADCESVKKTRSFSYPCNPDMKFAPIATCDIGSCAATLLAHNVQCLKGGQQTCNMCGDKCPHHNATSYRLTTCKALSMTELAGIYTKLAKNEVKYVQCSRQDCMNNMMKKGVPEWQVEGIVELFDMVNDGMMQTPTQDVEHIIGKKPMTMDEFMMKNANMFA